MLRVRNDDAVRIQHHDIACLADFDAAYPVRYHRQVDIESQNAERLAVHAPDDGEKTNRRRSLRSLKRLGNAHAAAAYVVCEPVALTGVVAFFALDGRILEKSAVRRTVADDGNGVLVRLTVALKEMIRRCFKAAFGIRIHRDHAVRSRRAGRLVHIARDRAALTEQRIVREIDKTAPESVDKGRHHHIDLLCLASRALRKIRTLIADDELIHDQRKDQHRRDKNQRHAGHDLLLDPQFP